MNKFITMGVLAVAVAMGGNELFEHYSADKFQAPVVVTQIEKNAQEFTHTRFYPGPYTPGANGEVSKIVSNNHLIGHINQFERHYQIKSNLNPEQATQLFKELKNSGQLPNFKINSAYKTEEISQNMQTIRENAKDHSKSKEHTSGKTLGAP